MYSTYNSLEDLPEHLILEIKHFFDVYKAFEEKETITQGFKDKDYAMKVIEQSKEKYLKEFN